MNTGIAFKVMHDPHTIGEALTALKESTGVSGEPIAGSDGENPRVSLHVAGTELTYLCAVKRKVDRLATLQDIKARAAPGEKTLLISAHLTSAMAEQCHALGIEFIDTAGNAFLTNGAGILIRIEGRKLHKGSIEKTDKTITPAALRMMFAFLAQPSMLNRPYRDISSAVQVATGAIGSALDILETRGFIGTTAAGKRIIASPQLMLSEWATGYISRLRPKLKTFRFTAPHLAQVMHQWAPEKGSSALGGAMAAEKITHHLNPATITMYMELDNPRALTELVKRFQLRADAHGPIEVVQAFWNMDYFPDSFPTVPLHLVYADLLATNDSRNLEVANQIYKKVIDHVHGG